MRTPDTAHLSPEDAELVRALYLERNRVGVAELASVRLNALAESTRSTRRTIPDPSALRAYVPQLARTTPTKERHPA